MVQTAQTLEVDVHWPRTSAHTPLKTCRGCKVRGSQLCCTIQNEPAFGDHLPFLRRFPRGTRIFEQERSSGILGVVRRGYARKSVIKVSGKRALVGLGMPGDFVGGLPGQEHDFDFEAATDIEICCYDSATIKRHLDTNQSFRKLMLQEIDHQHHRLLGMLWRNGTLNSRERIIAFIVAAVGFMRTEPLADGSLVLSMEIDRSDWADLTNTAAETISRTLRYLEEKNLVTSLTPYQFRICDIDLLATIAGVEPPAPRVEESERSRRMKTRFRSLNSGDRMTAVNARVHGSNRFNPVMKPVSVRERGPCLKEK